MEEKKFKTMIEVNEFIQSLGEDATIEPLINIQKTDEGYSLFYWRNGGWDDVHKTKKDWDYPKT